MLRDIRNISGHLGSTWGLSRDIRFTSGHTWGHTAVFGAAGDTWEHTWGHTWDISGTAGGGLKGQQGPKEEIKVSRCWQGGVGGPKGGMKVPEYPTKVGLKVLKGGVKVPKKGLRIPSIPKVELKVPEVCTGGIRSFKE